MNAHDHGPEADCYWRQRYLELEETMGYAFEGFSGTLSGRGNDPVTNALRRQLDEANAKLQRVYGSKLGKVVLVYWRAVGKVRRFVSNVRSRLPGGG